MRICIISQSSVTYAMKSQAILIRNGISADIVRLDPKQTKKSCGYGLKMNCIYIDKAKGYLRESGIPFSEIIG